MGAAIERLFLPLQRKLMPELLDMLLPFAGVFHNLMLLKIRKDYPGQARKVAHTVLGLGQAMFTKCVVVFDQDAPDLRDHGINDWISSVRVDCSLAPGNNIILNAMRGSVGPDETFTLLREGTTSGHEPRPGLVRLENRALRDDAGSFNGLGTTLFWAAWGYRNDRARLEQNLQFARRIYPNPSSSGGLNECLVVSPHCHAKSPCKGGIPCLTLSVG